MIGHFKGVYLWEENQQKKIKIYIKKYAIILAGVAKNRLMKLRKYKTEDIVI